MLTFPMGIMKCSYSSNFLITGKLILLIPFHYLWIENHQKVYYLLLFILNSHIIGKAIF